MTEGRSVRSGWRTRFGQNTEREGERRERGRVRELGLVSDVDVSRECGSAPGVLYLVKRDSSNIKEQNFSRG